MQCKFSKGNDCMISGRGYISGIKCSSNEYDKKIVHCG